MRRPGLLLALLGAGAILLRLRVRGRSEQDLWHEVTTAPDLR